LPRRGEELRAHAPRPVVGEGPKKPKQWKRDRQLDTFAREVAAGKPSLRTFRQLRLTAAEKRQLQDLTRRYSTEVQADVGKHLVRGTANAVASAATLPLTGQTAEETVRTVRENVSGLADGPRSWGNRQATPADVTKDVRGGVFPGFGRLWGGKAAGVAKVVPDGWSRWGDNVELVPTRTVAGFREFQQGTLDPSKVARLEREIKREGIQEPLILDYDDLSREAYLSEGNHRLQAALNLGIDEVPVRVIRAKIRGREAVKRAVPGTPGEAGQYLSPSAIGVGGRPLGGTLPGAEKIVDALPAAKRARLQQEKLRRVERGSRAAKSEAVGETVGGQAGYKAALAELKGELPKLKFGGLDGKFDQAAADKLFTHIQKHAELRPYEKLNAQRALSAILEGKVPTRSDIRWLDKVFGPEVSGQVKASLPFWQKAKEAGYQIINVPRALKSSFDLSAPFRQGLVLGARHPRMWAKEWKPMIRAFRSDRAYKDVMDDIVSRPSFPAMQQAKLAITDLEGLATREEAFMSNLAEDIPGIGIGVRASSRAYTTFLNKFRADAFDNYLETAQAQGLDIEDPKLLRSIAEWVNNATGRGGSSEFVSQHAVGLNALLFSPRLMASRLNLILNPKFYADLSPFARKQALRGMSQLLGAVSLTLWLAKMNGADVSLDPRSADFGKVRLGDTRIDVMGGMQQYMVLVARIAKGEMVSSSTGELIPLEAGFAKTNRDDILLRFGEQKMAPVPAFAWSYLKGENFEGNEFDFPKEFGRLFLPIGVESAYDTNAEYGPRRAAAGFGLNAVGLGVQTYPSQSSSGKKSGGPASWGQRSRGSGGGPSSWGR
jgi:hypothetical protein